MYKKTLLVIVLLALPLSPLLPASAQRRGTRMDTVDLLVLNGTLVTMDDKRRVIEDASVAIKGSCIVAVGARRDIVRRYTDRQTIDERRSEERRVGKAWR